MTQEARDREYSPSRYARDVEATLALSYADCVRQDYHSFLEGR